MTRELWLINAANALRPLFADAQAPLPDVLPQMSIGFPSRGALSGKVVGQCFHHKGAEGKATHVFVSPLHTSAYDVIDTLTHELVHVVTPGAKHGPGFVKVCKALGLTKGKPTSAEAGPELEPKLRALLETLGPCPHVALDPKVGLPKPQGTRMLKAECRGCGYLVRLTQKWYDVASPVCFNPDCDRNGRLMHVNTRGGDRE